MSPGSAPLNTIDLASPKAKANVAERVRLHRERLSSQGFERWEICTAAATYAQIQEIAQRENIAVSIAAEALLNIGIERYSEPLGMGQSYGGVRAGKNSIGKPLASFSLRLNKSTFPQNPVAIEAAIAAPVNPRMADLFGAMRPTSNIAGSCTKNNKVN